MYAKFFKRLIDLFLSVLALIFRLKNVPIAEPITIVMVTTFRLKLFLGLKEINLPILTLTSPEITKLRPINTQKNFLVLVMYLKQELSLPLPKRQLTDL